MENNLSPIVLFVYNRPEHTKKTLNALIHNELASDSDLIIFADGPKVNANEEQLKKICETRNICKTINGFKTITINEFETNKGLAQNIILGVTSIVNQYGKVIVLEDDIITGKYFLTYMNEALNKYKNEEKAYAVSGWYYPIRTEKSESFFLSSFNCWGWATWKDKWACFYKDAGYYRKKITKQQRKRFNLDGYFDYWNQIEDNYHGVINTWFIFWYASAFMKDGLCLFPSESLVTNCGCDGSGEHCTISYFNEVETIDSRILEFPECCIENLNKKNELKLYLKEINKHFRFRRILRTILRKLGLYSFIRKIYIIYRRGKR